MDPFFIRDSTKSFEEACASLQQEVPDHGFGLLAVHDLGQTLRGKGLPFPEECRIFEVCNPLQAAAVLANTMALNMALPCRISVYTEAGQTRIGMLRPGVMLAGLSADPSLAAVAGEVEASTRAIIAAAAAGAGPGEGSVPAP
ncbi:DUF302 domain-containing protein [Cyanobium sp. N.Huapi 1H5]|uniref:DUF302 domain-containing protein n=1 Tax=Cyanobium sp. N.Huapi 1H5 TaxID=2823719 RepID=UPI0020CCBD94|nr:DUF302 domain-containing protein [Cyanobium sp. N.Huapi 1H5]MCP9838633.1 DUF302 domain-containing protein [Cyanobium sp. N.Huapi 1H5]